MRLPRIRLSVCEEIVVRGEEFVKVRLTQDAYAHGCALALPDSTSATSSARAPISHGARLRYTRL
jgi:hypothetical protein